MAHLKELVNSVGFGRPFIDSGGAFGLNRLCEDDIPGYSSPPTVCNLAPVASVRGFSSMRVLRHWSALLRSSDRPAIACGRQATLVQVSAEPDLLPLLRWVMLSRRSDGSQTCNLVKTPIDQPGVFFATCARLIGPEVKLTIEQQLPGNLSPADWNLMMQILDAVKSAIPDAAKRPAGEVLEFVLGALRNCPANVRSSGGPLIEGT